MTVKECESIKKKIIATNMELKIILENIGDFEPKVQLIILKNYKKKFISDDSISQCVKDFLYPDLEGL